MPEWVVGWDVGGAHLKVALVDPSGAARSVMQLPCPLWQGIEQLNVAFTQARARLAITRDARHAITMTGEMVDLFADRRSGVLALSRHLEALFEAAGWQLPLLYAGDEGFVPMASAEAFAGAIASANWLASAMLVAARSPDAWLIDVGSTTTDLVPIAGGRVLSQARDDASRLITGELVYTGVVRTPLMALARRAPFASAWTGVMAEYFASAADIYRISGELHEAHDQHPAADQGEKTPTASMRRLARMLGRDLADGSPTQWTELALWFRERQLRMIEDAFAQLRARVLASAPARVVGAGCGRFLAQQLAMRHALPYVGFEALCDSTGVDPEWIATCAPAVAIACLFQMHSETGKRGG